MIINNTFKDNKPILYLVTTPIGNLNDMSFRGIEVLKQVDLILCEDTRTSLVLLNRYNIKKPLKSLHKFNEKEQASSIGELLQQGKNIALISDAGVPIISDPGAYLINELYNSGFNFNLCPVGAGPAYIHALICSGFVKNSNYFGGFLPHNDTKKEKELNYIKTLRETTACFYESVHRINSTIAMSLKILGKNTKICIARELTKVNEQFIIGNIDEINDYFNNNELAINKGEFVIIFSNYIDEASVDESELLKKIKLMQSNNISNKNIVTALTKEYKISKNYISKILYKN